MWYNPLIKLLLRSPLHGIASSSLLALTYTGHKSGKRYSVPLSYVKDGDDLLIITFKRRTWWRSLRGGAEVNVRVEGRDRRGVAYTIEEPEAVRGDLAIYLRKLPYLARHLEVEFDEDDNPDPEALARAAEKRVMVRIRFEEQSPA